LRDRFLGCLLGHAVGDAVGAPVEGMPGGICGALNGVGCIPAHLLALLEDGPKGRRYIESIAQRLFDRYQQSATLRP
jgi:ADP-ribosylglycohydrolase